MSFFSRMKGLMGREPATRSGLLELLSDERWSKELGADEITMLHGVLEVSQTQVREAMIPRSQMVVVDRDAPREEVLKTIVESGHSRFPVIGEDRDEVDGILLAKDVLSFFISTPDAVLDFSRFLRPATVIPESKRLNTLLKDFRNSRNHMRSLSTNMAAPRGWSRSKTFWRRSLVRSMTSTTRRKRSRFRSWPMGVI